MLGHMVSVVSHPLRMRTALGNSNVLDIRLKYRSPRTFIGNVLDFG